KTDMEVTMEMTPTTTPLSLQKTTMEMKTLKTIVSTTAIAAIIPDITLDMKMNHEMATIAIFVATTVEEMITVVMVTTRAAMETTLTPALTILIPIKMETTIATPAIPTTSPMQTKIPETTEMLPVILTTAII